MSFGGPFRSNSVHVIVRGEIPQFCSVEARTVSLDLGDITRAGEKTTDIDFSCNTPFTVTVESEEGGLVTQDQNTAGRFQNAVPYFMSLGMPLDRGRPLRIRDCSSLDLLNGGDCSTASSGRRTAINRSGRIKFEWETSNAPLLAGEYQDVVTVRLEFAP